MPWRRQKKSLKVYITLIMTIGFLMFGAIDSIAADVTIQDSSFTLMNGAARITDATALDGFCAKMDNNTTERNIHYTATDLSALKCGVSYDVYFKVKVTEVSNPTGDAFKIGVYDNTYGNLVIPEKTIEASGTQNGVWKEFKAGTFKPNSGVNSLSFYIAGTNNASQVSEIRVDYIIFKEYTPQVIEDSSFYLFGNSVRTTDGMAVDNSSAVLVNGTTPDWNIQAPIDMNGIEPGVSYDIKVIIKPVRASYMATGDMFGVGVYDLTNSTYPVALKTYNTSDAQVNYPCQWYFTVKINSSGIQLDPTHNMRVCFYSVNNASNFPSFRVDRVIITKTTVDDSYSQSISVYPYKISPANADGCNDTSAISYTLSSLQTTYVRVYDTGDNLIRTLVNGISQSGTNTVTWDGRNNSGNIVSNGLYTVKVNNGTNDILMKNVQVISGVTLTTPVNIAKNYFPKGVWFEGGEIPNNAANAGTYCDSRFADISNCNMNTVIVCNWHDKSSASVYTTTLDMAGQNNIKVIGLPDAYHLFQNESLFCDEVAMYEKLNETITPIKNHSSLYGYLLNDEPLYNDLKLADNLKDIKRMLETIDPNHPVIVDYNEPRNVQDQYAYQQGQVIVSDPYGAGSTTYPVGDFTHYCGFPQVSYESFQDFATLQARKNIASEVPSWNILQAFTGWGSFFRDPTAQEMRAMTYEAIGRGIKGFFYFMYQAEQGWNGLVDWNGSHTDKYSTVQTLLSEINIMQPTIQNIRRIGNFATASGGGGGGGAYSNADVTCHENYSTGDKYIVIVNHDCENSQNVTITINRAKLGIDISSISNVLDGANISYSTDDMNYTISNLNFPAGAGKIIKLVKSSGMTVYTGQDASFAIYNGATDNNIDISSSDSKSAVKVIQTTNGWDINWYWDKTQLAAGATYDLYAVVKIKYANDMSLDAYSFPYFPSPTGNAFSVGVYDCTTDSYPIQNTNITASSMENMLWYTIKIGSFVPSQSNNQLVYIYPADNPSNVYAVYVDKFYFVRR